VEALRLTQLAEQTRARSEQLRGDLPEWTRSWKPAGAPRGAEARFEELDMQLADSQERHAQLDDVVIAAERRWVRPASSSARWSAGAGGHLCPAQPAGPPGRAAARWKPPPAGTVAGRTSSPRPGGTGRLNDAAAQAGLQDALAVKLQREQALGALRSQYDDLTAKLRASDERRLQLERELDPLRQRITDFQLKEQAARLGVEQYSQQLTEARPTWPRGAKHEARGTCAWPACRARSTACTARSSRAGR
jgi:chromosome segregation protein